ncbi:putative Sulfatase [Hyella patelloides LEGE 07179]|uniref:Putative Sulfatase n=1 Tax=Hyella patelloides LEGE 07179 TaxID=945734 RepID=A0A563W306_9CYAN|nr:sulfatase-like hydrolase/transferase [Hyella patelloides]VEP18046.1 putative Sulfatase [Hyella patelloides LEGE 07179]
MKVFSFWFSFKALFQAFCVLFWKKNLVKNLLLLIYFAIAIIFFNPSSVSATIPRAERAVLFYFDGLHPDAISRFDLPNLKQLQAEGTTVETAIMTFPWHPTTGAYGQMHTTSLPNPITMTGNLFLQPNQPMLQDMFPRDVETAIATGSKAYDSISSGFDIVNLLDTSDAEITDIILETLEQHDPKFYRIQLQDVGRAGYQTINAPDGTPWQADIWHPDSPYEEAVKEADRQLGRFIAKMEELGRWDNTFFVFMADGQSRHGWHIPMDEESWQTPMIFHGPNVKSGQTIPYAEIIDVIPTMANALGIEPPNSGAGSGRVLESIFEDRTETTSDVPRRMLQFNQQIEQYLLLTAELRLLSVKDPRADNVLMLERNANALAFIDGIDGVSPFLGIEQIDRWSEAESFDQLLERNQAALEYLRQQLARFKTE